MRKVLSVMLLSALLVPVSFAKDRVSAPEGFTWQEIPELKMAFLKPADWFFKRNDLHGHPAFYISKENIDSEGQFRAGFSVIVYFKKKPAVEYAKKQVDRFAKKDHGDRWEREVGSFKEFGFQATHMYRDGAGKARMLMVANPKTNTVYWVVFESPEPDWDVAWKTGETIVNSLVLDEGI